jgi:hypothetical protein
VPLLSWRPNAYLLAFVLYERRELQKESANLPCPQGHKGSEPAETTIKKDEMPGRGRE